MDLVLVTALWISCGAPLSNLDSSFATQATSTRGRTGIPVSPECSVHRRCCDTAGFGLLRTLPAAPTLKHPEQEEDEGGVPVTVPEEASLDFRARACNNRLERPQRAPDRRSPGR
jgi:hypothetical protein